MKFYIPNWSYVHFLQIQAHCSKANHISDIMLCTVRNNVSAFTFIYYNTGNYLKQNLQIFMISVFYGTYNFKYSVHFFQKLVVGLELLINTVLFLQFWTFKTLQNRQSSIIQDTAHLYYCSHLPEGLPQGTVVGICLPHCELSAIVWTTPHYGIQ